MRGRIAEDKVSSHAEASCSAPLDPEVQEDLQHILKLNRKKIITQYAHYVSSLCDYVVERGVSVERLRTFLLKLPAFTSDEEDQEYMLLSGVEEKLERADSIYKIFDVLGKECASFLNYDIYRSIQDKYCSDIDCEDFKYPDQLKAYIDKHKIKEFFDINPQLEKDAKVSAKLVLKFDITVTAKIAKVVDLKSSLAALLKVNPSALRLFSIKEGCVIVTFLVPAFLTEVFGASRPVSSSLKEELLGLSVLWMKCGDFKVISAGKLFIMCGIGLVYLNVLNLKIT
jgi:hypothetical protein